MSVEELIESRAAPAAPQAWVPVGGLQGPQGVQGPIGPNGAQGPAGAGVPTPVVNGQWIKGVGGAAVWAAITPADVGLTKTTISTWAGGPPASPSDGDIWIATNPGSGGQRWELIYDAAESTVYKWKFVGGAAVGWRDTSGTNRQNTTANVWEFVPGQTSMTLVRAGFYRIRFGCQFNCTNSVVIYYGIGVGSTPGNVFAGGAIQVFQPGSGGYLYGSGDLDTVATNQPQAAGVLINPQMYSQGAPTNVTLFNPWFSLEPIKVS